ncbi:MAG: DNA repair protein RecN [Acidobacteriota bacterium]
MLTYLRIENFALIDQLELEFGPGLNLITGETGSGKSILVDAVELLIGGRASQEMIRQGADVARLEAIFELSRDHPVQQLLREHELAGEDPATVLVRRELLRNGANRVFINNRLCTLGMLAEIGAGLADVHGQHSQQRLLRPAAHLDILDEFAGLLALRRTAAAAFRRWRTAAERLQTLRTSERERLQRIDQLRFQIQEVDALQLRPGLVQELEEERRLLATAERRLTLSQEAYALLYEQDDSIFVRADRVHRLLQELAALDPRTRKACEALEAARFQLEEAAFDLREYVADLDFNPARLEALEERLDAIEKVRRKYADSLEELETLRHEWELELQRLEAGETEAEELEAEVDQWRSRFEEAAEELHARRREAAERLYRAVEEHLADLAMSRARFVVQIEAGEATPRGKDVVEFLFSANPGEEPKPLHKIASGGELSRLALALRLLVRDSAGPGTLVFDEVDAGIGGRTATALAEKLARVAAGQQVFCVTHLPQIAAYAAQHFHVGKEIADDRTLIRAKRLDWEQRVEELARLLAGERITETTRRQARELLESAGKATSGK